MDLFDVPRRSERAVHLDAEGKECVLSVDETRGLTVVKLARVPLPLACALEALLVEGGHWPVSCIEAHASPWEKHLFYDLRIGAARPGVPADLSDFRAACRRALVGIEQIEHAL